jgi:hypothetical protein
MKMDYTLTSGDGQVGTLKVRSICGTLATAESGDGCWTFKRVGFWKTSVTVRPCGAAADLAVFRHCTWDGGGTLEFSGGARFNASTSFWASNLRFTTPAGEPLVGFRFGGVFHRVAEVEVFPPAMTLAELPLLVMFGWYLAIMLDMDTASAVTTAAIGG